MSSDDLLFERRGGAGLITLNRPHALNAVSLSMVRELTRQLAEWETDPAVSRVIVASRDPRAFSAGGDLRALYDLGRAGRFDEALGYFREEYALNARIKRYRKPYVALIDGIVMGGGVGISVHGSHRVAGDKFRFAMPEVGIGFFPTSARRGSCRVCQEGSAPIVRSLASGSMPRTRSPQALPPIGCRRRNFHG